MIRVNFAHLCDEAFILEHTQKANIIGIFRFLYTRTFPLEYPKITIVMSFTAIEEEEGEHKVYLRIVREEDQQEITELVIPVNIMKMEGYKTTGYLQVKEKREQEMNLVAKMERVIFEKPGKYSLNIAFDEKEIYSIPFEIRVTQK